MMSAMCNKSVDSQLISTIEQFYYKEARLLDARCFQQWFALVDETIEYSIPTRYVPHPDPGMQDTEEFASVERELERAEGGSGSPLRFDHYLETFARTLRPYKTNAWAECPAPRTRRFVSNVEVEPLDDGRYGTWSNFQLFYSHNGADNHTYTGSRRDVLRESDGQFRICKREVIIDWNIITGPTLALIF